MKTPRLLAIFFMASCFNVSAIYAAEHHSGHGASSSGGGGGGGENACLKPQLTKFMPANLVTVAPGSAFSFLAFNVSKPEYIEVTVKTIPVDVATENKDSFYLVTGKLPAELVNTTARINIKVNAKNPKCNGENGWLVKIAEQ
ncbi:MAG: hypothetical protein M0Q44_07225 [Methylobacter sp.]|jgi:hypothetical protein|nr:hypothetical protein [Methylobacter sp.]